MPLDTIYLTRHGHRGNWTLDPKTGKYTSQFATPTGNPSDPTLTSYGVRQSHELAAHIVGGDVSPKPWRVYSSPFWRCLQTIEPSVRGLDEVKSRRGQGRGDGGDGVEADAELGIRVENGLGEWFGTTTFFHHPTPPTLPLLQSLPPRPNQPATPPTPSTAPFTLNTTRTSPLLYTSTRGESIPQLHNRLATALAGIIREVDAEVAASEFSIPVEQRSSKAILICSHAAPLIAIGRVLTGRMPDDSSKEDFFVFTAGLSTFRRRGLTPAQEGQGFGVLAEGTRIMDPKITIVPDWKGGKGVGGGWGCIKNGDCAFLSGGAERGWHFDGEESFDTGPMADIANSAESERLGTKL